MYFLFAILNLYIITNIIVVENHMIKNLVYISKYKLFSKYIQYNNQDSFSFKCVQPCRLRLWEILFLLCIICNRICQFCLSVRPSVLSVRRALSIYTGVQPRFFSCYSNFERIHIIHFAHFFGRMRITSRY